MNLGAKPEREDAMAKNRLSDLNDHLFAQLERLSDEELRGRALRDEIERANAISKIAQNIVYNAGLVFRIRVAAEQDLLGVGPIPAVFSITE